MKFKKVVVNELDLFYREAGDPANPAILLLHGFPTSSAMFRDLMRDLEDRYYLLAPDYPGYGHSSAPTPQEFEYTFDNLAHVVECFLKVLRVKKFSLYVMDYGAPVGFRIAARHPDWIEALLIQNGNAYDEGLEDFWIPFKAYWQNQQDSEAIGKLRFLLTKEATYWQYTNGARDLEKVSPDAYTLDQALLDRPGNDAVQMQLFLSYGSNPPLYPSWQQYFREHQPPTLITWGKGDYIFPPSGAHPYLRDLPRAELHLLDAGHFALEEEHAHVAELIDAFLQKHREPELQEAAPTSGRRAAPSDDRC
ncbi:alpha/beta hydrolase [Hymenobacter sp. 15J16-1T3B]|uniref:alpha/beta fold hydrolase n=1 Tax=Hymenobacter sp. 15J16-1T3B TaxID=2886941 RepID=UPI001D120C42|nr:alpha/beta hydrolase [Hymenobacter sp. 15J16-1T3B]MCC3159769.1 alpha/beta hydrolase [Hymenobacter sp. 15J16-1T3B]